MKVLSNLEIARSLRNGFRASLGAVRRGGRATEFGRGASRLPAETQLRIPLGCIPGVRAWGISFTLERGTTQTADQGPQDDAQWQRKWDRGDSRDVGLEAATISKVRNSLPVEPSRAENDGDSSVAPQSRIGSFDPVVGERCRQRRRRTDDDRWSVGKCVCRNE